VALKYYCPNCWKALLERVASPPEVDGAVQKVRPDVNPHQPVTQTAAAASSSAPDAFLEDAMIEFLLPMGSSSVQLRANES